MEAIENSWPSETFREHCTFLTSNRLSAQKYDKIADSLPYSEPLREVVEVVRSYGKAGVDVSTELRQRLGAALGCERSVKSPLLV